MWAGKSWQWRDIWARLKCSEYVFRQRDTFHLLKINLLYRDENEAGIKYPEVAFHYQAYNIVHTPLPGLIRGRYPSSWVNNHQWDRGMLSTCLLYSWKKLLRLSWLLLPWNRFFGYYTSHRGPPVITAVKTTLVGRKSRCLRRGQDPLNPAKWKKAQVASSLCSQQRT